MDDALFAKLLGMGFEFEQIQACYEALSRTSTSLNLQKATDWLLDKPSPGKSTSNTLVLTTPTDHTPNMSEAGMVPPDIQKAVSSSRDFHGTVSSGGPPASRYNLGEEHMRDQERFALKSREEAVKKARERRRADMLAKEQIRRQIQEDKLARDGKTAPLSEVPSPTTPTAVTPPTSEATPTSKTTPTSGDPPASTSETCRVQVKLSNGRVLRRVFPSSATLSDVIEFVVSSDVTLSSTSLTLIQPFPRHEYTPAEGQRSLASLGLCPSTSLVVGPSKKRGMASAEPVDPSLMEVDKDSSPEDADGSSLDSDDEGERVNPPLPLPPAGHQRLPPRGRRGPIFNPFNAAADETFGGQGHRLGGRETQVVVGDSVRQSQRAVQAAKAAALQRGSVPMGGHAPSCHAPSPHSLEDLCTHVLVSQSSHYGMPSCAPLPPRLAQRLVAALKREKKLNSKTLMAFYKCPIQVVNLDNYLFATNDLLANLSHFPCLQQLSLCGCPIITDRAMADMLPYLTTLTSLKLNGCSQLSQAMFRALRGCKKLEVLELSQMKVSDEGLQLLLYYSLPQLSQLDLSCTQVTAGGLRLFPAGAPGLTRLSLECTQVAGGYSPLTLLQKLRSLNLSRCPAPSEEALQVLGRCGGLETLNLSGMALEGRSLEKLAGLGGLKNLRLPERNLFFDVAMEAVSAFPLVSLDLTDYLHITDTGISCLAGMTSLTSLSLSRTKLTDAGMPFLEGLLDLRELCLDNTLVTDAGLSHVSGLVHLELLSLADTRVTSRFLLEGVLKRLNVLNKLNLSRTFVCDRGMATLALPSLTMLNVDWTCITMATTLPGLINTGCPVLETLRNRNIAQPLPRVSRDMAGNAEKEEMEMV